MFHVFGIGYDVFDSGKHVFALDNRFSLVHTFSS